MIYVQSLRMSQLSCRKDLDGYRMQAITAERPSPLLGVNRQIRDEMIALLQNARYIINLTPYGEGFDEISLSAFIAQKRPRSYDELDRLEVHIWPPHHQRPEEMKTLWDGMRMLREKLRAGNGRSRLIVRFKETEFANWSQRYLLQLHCPALKGLPGEADNEDDLEMMLGHLACIMNNETVEIEYPPSYVQSKRFRHYAGLVIGSMQGHERMRECNAEFLTYCDGSDERREAPERQIERIATVKVLIDMKCQMMTWDQFHPKRG